MRHQWTVVHGRFQPFHLGHLEYLGLGLARSDRVVVGITNPSLRRLVQEKSSDHRHLSSSNPFSYFERAEMVLASIPEAASRRGCTVRTVPFDVSDASQWRDFLPEGARHLVTLNEAWDEEKARRFAQAGFEVETVPGNPLRITATEVRRRMAEDEDWRLLVPSGVAKIIDTMRPTGDPLGRTVKENTP